MLAAQDPFEVSARLKSTQPGVSLNLLYALNGAVENRDGRRVARDDRTAILLRLDAMGSVQEPLSHEPQKAIGSVRAALRQLPSPNVPEC